MTVGSSLFLLFLLLAIGTPVSFAMAAAGSLGLFLFGGMSTVIGVLRTTPISTVSSYELITIPMFLLMAEFVLASGIADDLFRAVAAWVGRIRGGLAMATALSGAGFGAICGSSTASAATLSSASLPAMVKQGYEPKLAAGVVAISGTLAMLIPPSVALVIYGLIADVSIGKLLIAGVAPAIIVTLTIIATVWFLVWRDPTRAPPTQNLPMRERLQLLTVVGPIVCLFGLVTGIIYTGIATPTEASALGAFGAFLLLIKTKGARSKGSVLLAFRRALRNSCMIALILIGAHIFGYFFALTFVTQDLVAWVSELGLSRWIVIIAILVVLLVLGTFLDQVAILVLTVPVALPLVTSMGFDPIWFGVLMIITAEVGLISPPVGLNCFVVARYSGRPLSEVFRGSFPHMVAHLLVIAVLVALPEVVLWLPNRM